MSIEIPLNDPSGAYGRQKRAARRKGKNKQCACGEKRPNALVPNSDPTTCTECQRKKEGYATDDKHHFAGEANHPLTIPVPVNDHRAVLTPAQYDWPKNTRENPDGSPLLAGAACVRGFVDTIIYLIKKGVLWIAKMLETLEDWLIQALGRKYWVGTPIEQFAPRRPK